MKNKLLTAILALFLPLVSAGQQSLTAFLLTAGANGVTVQRVDAISPFPSCHNVFTATVLPTCTPQIEKAAIEENCIENGANTYTKWFNAYVLNLSVGCNQ